MPSSPPPGTVAHDGLDLVLQPLPDLRIGPNSTKSPAIHDIHFKGQLEKWDNFMQEVEQHHLQFQWQNSPASLQEPFPAYPHSLAYEQVYVGDEHSVQGRFSQLIGQAMGGVFGSQAADLYFGDYKSCLVQKSYNKIPDIIIRTAAGKPLVVGEEKVFWISEHSLSVAVNYEERLRHVIGQTAMYMRDLNLEYGFLSTYEETMFLRQEDRPGHNQTVLKYSSVIKHKSGYVPGQSITLRQAFFFVGLQAAAATPFTTSPSRRTGWVSDRKGELL